MISHEHGLIYVHIPKTAGTSIEKKLGHFDELTHGVQDHRTIREIAPFSLTYATRLAREDNFFLLLRRLRDAAQRRHQPLTPKQYQRYFKFAFVRNPWARAHSWYKNVMRDEKHRHKSNIPDDCSFKYFLQNHLDEWALRPQLFWLKDVRGQLPLDFIGRFENLSEDFARVCEKLNLPDPSLPKLVVGGGSHYTDFYDDETRNLIARVYREEIDYFGYTFDN